MDEQANMPPEHKPDTPPEQTDSIKGVWGRFTTWIRQETFGIMFNALFWTVVGVLMTKIPRYDVVLLIAAVVVVIMAIYWLAVHVIAKYVIKPEEPIRIGFNVKQGRLLQVAAAVCICSVLVCAFIYRDRALDTFGPEPNAYAHWTSEPDIEIQANRYALLIEFGVDGSATKGIDITITLDERYETVDSWLSSSDRLDKPTDSEFSLGFGPEDSPQETKEPPSYSYHDSYHSIEPNSSLYVYFQSDGPLKIDTVSLNGKKLKPVEGIGDSK